MTLAELRTKEVVNILNGKRLGKVMDIEFHPADRCVTALVVPAQPSLIQSLRGEKCGVAIPWEDVKRIGDDVVLVALREADPPCGPCCR